MHEVIVLQVQNFGLLVELHAGFVAQVFISL